MDLDAEVSALEAVTFEVIDIADPSMDMNLAVGGDWCSSSCSCSSCCSCSTSSCCSCSCWPA
jgi:hypothetical protein